MHKALRAVILAAFVMIFAVLLITGCSSTHNSEGPLATNTVPVTTEEVIPDGTFYLRCSEPENNKFSIQFVGAVPTRKVDYVGFEAARYFEDGTKGALSAIKLYTLFNEIVDEDSGETITAADFGMDGGYLYVRALDGISVEEEGLAYEITAYYVIGDQKYYTARQVFRVEDLLNDHIISNPQPFDVEEKSPLIDVQNWNKLSHDEDAYKKKYQKESYTGGVSREEMYCDYFYIGSSVPDNNGRLKFYACAYIPESEVSALGIRYNFTQLEGNNKGVSTSLQRYRTATLYKEVISEKDTLTPEDFGKEDGYLAVFEISENINTVLYSDYQFNILTYSTRNALESVVAYTEILFSDIVEACVLKRTAVDISIYTFTPPNYNEWVFIKETEVGAVGSGVLALRVSGKRTYNEQLVFNLQVAGGLPTRFLDKLVFVYKTYDKNGNLLSTKNNEITIETAYSSIIGNNDTDITSADFGYDRGYVITMLLNNIEFSNTEDVYEISAYYTYNKEVHNIFSYKVDSAKLVDMVEQGSVQ